MIQVKEFVDTDSVLAEKRANEFLAGLEEGQVVDICYGSMMKQEPGRQAHQRSAIMIVYRTENKKQG